MKSLTLAQLRALQNSGVVSGDYTYLSHGVPRTIRYHANWPSNRHELLSAREAFESYRATRAKGEN